MKRLVGLLLSLICLIASISPPAFGLEPTALYDSLDIAFSTQLSELDRFFTLDVEYIHYKISSVLYPWELAESMGWQPMTVRAEAFEEQLYRYFAPDDDLLARLRTACSYNESAQTYQVQAYGGFGGGMKPRRYMGYVALGDGTYKVFWQNIGYLFLDSTDGDLMSRLEQAGWPSKWEHEGRIYHSGAEGYYTIASYDSFGKCYTVSMNEGIVRVHACDTFTAADLPDAFDHVKEVTLIAPDGMTVLGASDAFPDRSTLEIVPVTDDNLLEAIRSFFPSPIGEWSAFTMTAASLPQSPITLRMHLSDTERTPFVCLSDSAGNMREIPSTIEPTEDGALLSFEIADSLTLFAVCLVEPSETDPTPIIPPTVDTSETAPIPGTPIGTTAPVTHPITESRPSVSPPYDTAPYDTAPYDTEPSDAAPYDTAPPNAVPPALSAPSDSSDSLSQNPSQRLPFGCASAISHGMLPRFTVGFTAMIAALLLRRKQG